MSIGSIGGATVSLQGLQSAQSTSAVGGARDADGDGDGSRVGGDSSGVSKRAQMLQQLKDLSQSDPAKFKQVVGDMAKELRADAQKESGAAATALGKIADKLDQVAASGDVSQLAPPAASGGAQGASKGAAAYKKHGHHHGGGGKAGGVSSVQRDLAQAFASALGPSASSAVPATSAVA
jgi:hypothetical protein